MARTCPFRDINVHASSNAYTFSSPSSPHAHALVIQRPTGDIRTQDAKSPSGQRMYSIYGILGMITLRLDKYIIVITKAQSIGEINGHEIYNVVSTDLLPLRERSVRDPDEDAYIAMIRQLLRTGPMYFSYTMDITNSLQRQAQADLKQPLWACADDRFFWNRFIQSDLIKYRQGDSARHPSKTTQPSIDPYILPVMFGMLRITKTAIFGKPLSFLLVTRRSRYRAGARYFSRGIDPDGHVSNFNETEQAVVVQDSSAASGLAEAQVLAYVQTRGSVPAYWAQVNELKYTPRIQVKSVDSALDPARRHFEEQVGLYGEIYMVNLVNQKGSEKLVKDLYEDVVKSIVTHPNESQHGDRKTSEKIHTLESSSKSKLLDHLHYIYFDFHNETKGLQWQRTKILLDQLEDGLRAGGYYRGLELQGRSPDVRSKQSAVVRTNCMDCLDRTNVVQSMLGRYMLKRMLSEAGVLRDDQDPQNDQAFEVLFRNVWADNADVVSRSYSGTGALKTDFTRTGERTKAGALSDLGNSCARYVLNNFTDGTRQDAFDLFHGVYKPEQTGLGSASQFVDRRPLIVQSIPYIMIGFLFVLPVSLFTRQVPGASPWPVRTVMLTCITMSIWAYRFMFTHGALYVHWPRLAPQAWQTEVVQEHLEKAAHDPVVGQMITTRHRAATDPRLNHLEEGKKRIE